MNRDPSPYEVAMMAYALTGAPMGFNDLRTQKSRSASNVKSLEEDAAALAKAAEKRARRAAKRMKELAK